jgi:hypothetical protein
MWVKGVYNEKFVGGLLIRKSDPGPAKRPADGDQFNLYPTFFKVGDFTGAEIYVMSWPKFEKY